MKKGCFIQAVVLATILIAAAIYIIQYKLEDWLVKPGKRILFNEIIRNWDNEFDYVSDSVPKDSLKSIIIYYFENIKSLEEVVNLDEGKILEEFNLAIEDSLITNEEVSKLTLLLKKDQYEKSKSSRN
jgi:hypothetical protein